MTQRVAVGLTVVNLVLLVVQFAQMPPLTAQGSPGLLRGTGLEIIDGQGRARATISILPKVLPSPRRTDSPSRKPSSCDSLIRNTDQS